LHDASTIRQFERLGVGGGWHCVELGAGAGSIARWLADVVGTSGSVTAVDRDTSLLADLAARPNVTVVEGDLMTMSFGSACFDLVHSRSVLMHVEDPDTVLEHLVPALRPGAVVLFEEADGEPAQRAATGAELPAPFRDVMVPLAMQWTWARTLACRLVALGFTDVHDDVREDLLTGASPAAAFWSQTLATIRPIVTDAARMESLGRHAVADSSYDAMIELLENPAFSAPFAARHRVSARRP
jgi:SAM-dependent methyltransferase